MGRLLARAAWLALFAGLLFVLWQRDVLTVPVAMLDPTSEAAFERWVAEDPSRRVEYQQFEAFLQGEGVSDIVPAWQLARIDQHYAARCNEPVWRLPPRELWPNIVPAMKLVREHVIPAIGEVEVQSSWRTPELNVCVGGAAASRHLDFEAMDLLAVDPPGDLSRFYAELCSMQDEAGPQSRMGLGAYYDDSDDTYNRAGRFHIDAEGYRSWGRSYTSASSPC